MTPDELTAAADTRVRARIQAATRRRQQQTDARALRQAARDAGLHNRHTTKLTRNALAAHHQEKTMTTANSEQTPNPMPPALYSDSSTDPLGSLAYRHLVDRATEAHAIALHYQADTSPEAATEAMSTALAAVAPGFAAAAIARIAEDPALNLTEDQTLYLGALATFFDLDVVEDITGANGSPAS